jgi:hypothetical protein
MALKFEVNKDFLIEQLSHLEKSRNLSSFRILDRPSAAAEKWDCLVVAEVQLSIETRTVTLQIGLDGDFPYCLPKIFLIPWNAFGFLPHVEKSGYVCYAPTEGLALDSQRPLKILEEAFERATTIISDGLMGKNKRDFVDEFKAYWSSIEGADVIISYINPDDTPRKIVAARSSIENNIGKYSYVSDDENTVATFYNDNEHDKLTHLAALYLPLAPDTLIEPFDKEALTPKNVRDKILTHLPMNCRKRLRRFTKKYKSEEIVIFRLLRPSGGEVLFGILFRGVHCQHPLVEGGQADELVPLVLTRLDKSYLLPRGGASTILQAKRVALVGCGSVGGYIAFQLAHCGILDITLIDHDNLAPDNIFRHVLGKEYIGKSKADALKEELTRKLPFVKSSAVTLPIEKVLSTGMIKLQNYDLIVFATGNDIASLYVNRRLYSENTPPLLFTWLEPYGIGGHVLLSKNKDSKGCFQCLYTPMREDDSGQFHNRAAFAAPNQSFSKDIAGCANRFTPYSSLDSDRTATLSVRIAIQLLQGRISGNLLCSWIGHDADFVNAGFRTSNRYKCFKSDAEKMGVEYFNPLCPICGTMADH